MINRQLARELLRELDEIERQERARERSAELSRSLRLFSQDAHAQHNAGTRLSWGWSLDAVCDLVQACLVGDVKLAMVNMLPRSYKSTIASIDAHPYDWLTNPWRKWFTGGYDRQLAVMHNWQSRTLIESEWYQTLLAPDGRQAPWELVGDQNAKEFYANTMGGQRLAAQVGGGTGKGGQAFVIDDPLGIDESYSDAANEKANRWFFQTVMSRLDDPKSEIGFVLLLQHRLRPDDTSGIAQAEHHGFVVLDLALEYDPRRICVVPEIQFEDPRVEVGELLLPERWGGDEVEKAKKRYGPLYQAICNQRPETRGQKLLKREWFKRWGEDHPLPKWFEHVQSWDLSTKGLDPSYKAQSRKLKRSKIGGLVAGMTPSACYLFDMIHLHASSIEQEPIMRAAIDKWPDTARTYIEDESHGSHMILALTVGDEERGVPGIPGVVGVNPTAKGGKYQRLAAVARFVRAGNVYVPADDQSFPWVRELLDLLCEFPNVEYDEIPDCFSQLLSEEWLPDGLPEDEDDAKRQAEKFARAFGESDPGLDGYQRIT